MSLLENHEFSLIASSVVNCLRIAYVMLVTVNSLIPKEYRCATGRSCIIYLTIHENAAAYLLNAYKRFISGLTGKQKIFINKGK